MRRLSFICYLLLLLFTGLFMPVAAYEQAVATSSELTPVFLRGSDTIPLPLVVIPEPVSGKGRLSITIETFTGENPKRIAQHAIRAELWLGDHRLASLNEDEENVSSEKNRRIFNFPELEMAYGYYFITVRLYSRGGWHGRRKSHEQTFQVGVHPDRLSRVYKIMPFFHW